MYQYVKIQSTFGGSFFFELTTRSGALGHRELSVKIMVSYQLHTVYILQQKWSKSS